MRIRVWQEGVDVAGERAAEGVAADAVHGGLNDCQADSGRNSGIHGIAPTTQHLKTCLSRQGL